jgi:hypothetical protein
VKTGSPPSAAPSPAEKKDVLLTGGQIKPRTSPFVMAGEGPPSTSSLPARSRLFFPYSNKDVDAVAEPRHDGKASHAILPFLSTP